MAISAAGLAQAAAGGPFPFDDFDVDENQLYEITGYSAISGIPDRQLKQTTSSAFASITVDDLAELRARSPSEDEVYLAEPGKEGFWQWESGNQSAEVEPAGGADNHYAFYVAPDSDTSGASGAWKRIYTGSVKVSWAGFGNDWNKIRPFIQQVADKFPHCTVELEAMTYEVDGGSGNASLYDITVIGQGVDKTIIRQVGSVTAIPIINISSVLGNGKASNVTIKGITLDANDRVTTAALALAGSNNVVVEDVDVVGWKFGITTFSVRENAGSGIVATAATKSIFKRINIYNPAATIGQVYPFQFNAPWGAPPVYDVYVEDIYIEGVGGYYIDTNTSGTADHFNFQNCKKVRGQRLHSTQGGELGFNCSRGTEDVYIDQITTTYSDADGVNIGSGQFVIELADTTGFVMGEPVQVNNDPLFTGVIAGYDDTRLLIASATINTDNALPVAGDTVAGMTSGTSKALMAWKGGAHNIHVSNIISYGNSRDEKPTGNLYAGVKLNLATDIVVTSANCREMANPPTQNYGYYVINSFHSYSGVDCRDNVTSEEPFSSGRNILYSLFSSPESATNLILNRGLNITAGAAGEIVLADEIAYKVKANTGLEQTITDIVAQPGASLVDGQLAVFTPSTDTTVLRFQAGTRLRMPNDITLRTISSSLVFQYRDDSAGFWTLFSDSRRKERNYNYGTTLIANSAVETEIGTGGAYRRLLGKARFKVAGVITNTSGANQTITFALKMGADVLYTGTTAAIINGAQPRPYELIFDIYRVTDTLQKIVLNGRVGANAASKFGTDEIIANIVDYTTSAIDLSATGTEQVKMFATLSAADPNFSLSNEISEFSSDSEG